MGKARKRARKLTLESMQKDLQNMKAHPLRVRWSLCGSGFAKPSTSVVDSIYGPMREVDLHKRILKDSQEQLDRVHAQRVAERRAKVEAYAAGEKLER